MLSREREIGFVLPKKVFGRYSMLDIGRLVCGGGGSLTPSPSPIPLRQGYGRQGGWRGKSPHPPGLLLPEEKEG
jgi:hypothetical protein